MAVAATAAATAAATTAPRALPSRRRPSMLRSMRKVSARLTGFHNFFDQTAVESSMVENMQFSLHGRELFVEASSRLKLKEARVAAIRNPSS